MYANAVHDALDVSAGPLDMTEPGDQRSDIRAPEKGHGNLAVLLLSEML